MSYDNYEGALACYETSDGSLACFFPRCPKCGRFVKTGTVFINRDGEVKRDTPNATCKKHGDIIMPFDMYYSKEDFDELR